MEEILDFGGAVRRLQDGKKVARKGWNGKGMYIQMRKATEELNEHFVIFNSRKTFDTWVPSISDILAEDWEVACPAKQ